ncbi:MAG: YciI family protein [Rhizobiaceae bacterium]
MEYLCLVYFEPTIFDRMTPAEKKKLDADSMEYDRVLASRGHLIEARALDSVTKAQTVMVRGSKVSSTDGPFAETKEHLGGFILVKAADMPEARRIAAGIPLAKYGRIEVRPIYDVPGA